MIADAQVPLSHHLGLPRDRASAHERLERDVVDDSSRWALGYPRAVAGRDRRPGSSAGEEPRYPLSEVVDSITPVSLDMKLGSRAIRADP